MADFRSFLAATTYKILPAASHSLPEPEKLYQQLMSHVVAHILDNHVPYRAAPVGVSTHEVS